MMVMVVVAGAAVRSGPFLGITPATEGKMFRPSFSVLHSPFLFFFPTLVDGGSIGGPRKRERASERIESRWERDKNVDRLSSTSC